MASTTRRKTALFPWIAALLALALSLGAGVFVAARTDLAAGLALRRGSAVFYAARGVGPSLSAMRSGEEVWGFVEWPERGFYGFFDGRRERDGEYYAGIRAPGGAARLILSPPRLFEGARLRIEGPRGLGGSFALERAASPSARVSTLAGRLDAEARPLSPLSRLFSPLSPADGAGDAGVSAFHVDLLDGAGAGRPSAIEAALAKLFRRGMGARAYALGLWKDFRAGRALPQGPKTWPGSLVERQYLIASLPSAGSAASERYVFDGGAHGNTVMLAASFDAESGLALESGDLFRSGAEAALGEKIRAEALRLLDPPGGSLVGAGFFEDKIAPSAEFFVCRSGVGFHYDRYALAPYSFGDYTFVVPWAELGGLLKDPARWATR
ncbi:RsiV family protein [bacterium]|nr:RsiV family protein [bacterium]